MNDISAAASTLYKINKYKVVAVVLRAGAPNWMREGTSGDWFWDLRYEWRSISRRDSNQSHAAVHASRACYHLAKLTLYFDRFWYTGNSICIFKNYNLWHQQKKFSKGSQFLCVIMPQFLRVIMPQFLCVIMPYFFVLLCHNFLSYYYYYYSTIFCIIIMPLFLFVIMP